MASLKYLLASFIPIAILHSHQTSFLLSSILSWSQRLLETYSIKRRFSSSLTSLRSDKDAAIAFAELRRTATQCLTLSLLEILIKYSQESQGSRQIILDPIYDTIDQYTTEVQSSQFRIPSYKLPLRQLIAAIWEFSDESLMSRVAMRIKDFSKSPKYNLYIEFFGGISLKVYPHDRLTSSLGLLETLGNYYSDAKGVETRAVFAKTLSSLLEPLLPIISAEVNLPQWDRVVVKTICKRAMELCEKGKYRIPALCLFSTCLCLSPKDMFLKRWESLAHSIASTMVGTPQSPDMDQLMLALLRLIWTYTHKYPEAFASQTAKLQKLVSLMVPTNPNRRFGLSETLIQVLLFGFAECLTQRQLVSYLRDIVMNLFEIGDELVNGRLLIGLKCFMFLGCVHVGSSPNLDRLNIYKTLSWSALEEGFKSLKPDYVLQEAIDVGRGSVARIFQHIYGALIPKTLSEWTKVKEISDSSTWSSFKLLLDVFPVIRPKKCNANTQVNLLILQSIIRLYAYPDRSISQNALACLQKLDFAIYVSGEDDVLNLYWHLTEVLEEIPEKNYQMIESAYQALPVLVELTCDSFLSRKVSIGNDSIALMADIGNRCLIGLLSSQMSVTQASYDAIKCLTKCLSQREWTGIDLIDEIYRLSDIMSQAMTNQSAEDDYIPALRLKCPSIVALFQRTALVRFQKLQEYLIATNGLDRLLLDQWRKYLMALLNFGPPPPDPLMKKTGGRLSRIFSFASSDSSGCSLFESPKGFLQFSLLAISVPSMSEILSGAYKNLNASFLVDFCSLLKPMLAQCSADFRNPKYQVNRRAPSKQDELKIFITRILKSLVHVVANSLTDLETVGRTIQKFILEAFFFALEVDHDEKLVNFRYYLTDLILSYHDLVHECSKGNLVKFEYFPFKLQSELFPKIMKWSLATRDGPSQEANHCKSVAIRTSRSVGDLTSSETQYNSLPLNSGNKSITLGMDSTEITWRSNNNSLSTSSFINSSQPIAKTTLKISIPAHQKRLMYERCMVSLCKGLLNPLPQYRTESLPPSQVIKWIDTFSSIDTAEEAIYNLLVTNGTLMDKMLQKAFQSDYIESMDGKVTVSDMSQAYYRACARSLVEKATNVPITTLISVITMASLPPYSETYLDSTRQLNEELVRCYLGNELVSISALCDSVAYRAAGVVPDLIYYGEQLIMADPVFFATSFHRALLEWIEVLILPSHGDTLVLESLLLYSIVLWRLQKFDHLVEVWTALLTSWSHHPSLAVSYWISAIHTYGPHILTITTFILQTLESDELIESAVDCLDPTSCYTAIKTTTHTFDSGVLLSRQQHLAKHIVSLLPRDSHGQEFSRFDICKKWFQNSNQFLNHPEMCRLLSVEGGITVDVLLRWSVRCPIKAISIECWQMIGTLQNAITSADLEKIVETVHSLLSLYNKNDDFDGLDALIEAAVNSLLPLLEVGDKDPSLIGYLNSILLLLLIKMETLELGLEYLMALCRADLFGVFHECFPHLILCLQHACILEKWFSMSDCLIRSISDSMDPSEVDDQTAQRLLLLILPALLHDHYSHHADTLLSLQAIIRLTSHKWTLGNVLQSWGGRRSKTINREDDYVKLAEMYEGALGTDRVSELVSILVHLAKSCHSGMQTGLSIFTSTLINCLREDTSSISAHIWTELAKSMASNGDSLVVETLVQCAIID